MNNTKPLLSVTVLNYNYAHYLPQCLDSIINQSFSDFEVIVINDKSTDNTLEVLQPYLSDPRIRLVDHKINKGFVNSLIEGVELSVGKYITVISADDWIYSKNAFERQIQVLEQDPEIAFIYSAYAHYDGETCPTSIWQAPYSQSTVESGLEMFKKIVLSPFLLHTGTVIRRTAYDAVGGYDTNFKNAVDTKIWLSLCTVGKVAYINEILYSYRRHGTNMSKNPTSFQRAMSEILQAIDYSFSLWPVHIQHELGRLRNEALRRALVAFAVDDIFRNHYTDGWKLFYISLKIKPFDAIFQRMFPILILRTLLGSSIFEQLRKFTGKKTTESQLLGVPKVVEVAEIAK